MTIGEDETLVDIAVDRKVTSLNLAALLYAVNGNPPSLDAVISVEDFLAQLQVLVEETIGTRFYNPLVFDFTTDVIVGDGAYEFPIPAAFNGWELTYIRGFFATAGVTGTSTIQLANKTTGNDMLSTKLTFASGAIVDDGTVVINATYKVVSTNNILRFDIDTVSTTKPKGFYPLVGFTRP